MQKINLRKNLKAFYQAVADKVVEINVPAFNFLMIDGQGDPNISLAYRQALEALFAVAYTLKFTFKKGPQALDYPVMPLECLWWADDMAAFASGNKEQWQWTAMIMQPDFINRGQVEQAMADAGRKKPLPALARMRYEAFQEGRCAQTLHIGPFSDEGPTIARVHQFIEAAHAQRRGKHHEIYLSDIRRTQPEKWQTIVRQPMA